MIDATVYYIPYRDQTIVVMGAPLSPYEVCLRIGVAAVSIPEDSEKRQLLDFWVFRNYQMVIHDPVSWVLDIPEIEPSPTMGRGWVRFGDAERVRSSVGFPGISQTLFAWFEYEGETRQCISILIEKSRYALRCATIRDEVDIFNSIERFFTPRVKDWDEE